MGNAAPISEERSILHICTLPAMFKIILCPTEAWVFSWAQLLAVVRKSNFERLAYKIR